MLKCCFGDPLGVDSTCSHPPSMPWPAALKCFSWAKAGRKLLAPSTRSPKSSQIFTWSTKLICSTAHRFPALFTCCSYISCQSSNILFYVASRNIHCAWIWT